MTDTPLESLQQHFPRPTFDLIVSRAVLEHILDMDRALETMDSILKPGGIMIHEVDLRDHGIFTRYGLNPLTFLTLKKRTWYRLSSHNGSPNRVPMNYYVTNLERRGYKLKVLKVFTIAVTGKERKVHKEEFEYGVDYNDDSLRLVQSIRPWLDEEFRSLPDNELITGAFFLVARKSVEQP